MLCYAMLCYAMLCYAMLCYAMLRYAMLFVARMEHKKLENWLTSILCNFVPMIVDFQIGLAKFSTLFSLMSALVMWLK
jgi:hypothetical protein